MGSGQVDSSTAPAATGAAWAGGAPDGENNTSHSPPASSFASCVKPFEPSTCSSGTGLNVASKRRPSPGFNAPTAFMIISKGSPPARRTGRTSTSTNVVVIAVLRLSYDGPRKAADAVCVHRQAGAAWLSHRSAAGPAPAAR